MLSPIDRLPAMPGIPAISMVKTASKAAAALTGSGGGSSGGGYTFTPEEIDEVIRQWKELRDGLEDDERDAENVANVQAPGREFASGDFQKAASPSGEALVRQTRRMKQYVEMYIAKLEEAKAGTEAQNEQARDEIKKFGGML